MKKVIVSIVLVLSVVLFSNCSYAEEKGLVGLWKFDESKGEIIKDFSGNGNDGTTYGWPVATAGKIGQALSFNGVNDYVDCGNKDSVNITGAISIELWIKLSEDPKTAGKNYYLIGKGSALGKPTGQGAYTLSLAKGNNNLYFDMGDGTTRSSLRSRTATWNTDVWYHIAATWDGTTNPGTQKVYINGVLARQRTSAISSLRVEDKPLRIGYQNSLDYFNGAIDEVRIYNRALTETEIENHYKTGSQVI